MVFMKKKIGAVVLLALVGSLSVFGQSRTPKWDAFVNNYNSAVNDFVTMVNRVIQDRLNEQDAQRLCNQMQSRVDQIQALESGLIASGEQFTAQHEKKLMEANNRMQNAVVKLNNYLRTQM
jgi:hypothetical protein